MTEKSWFWSGQVTGDALDAPYSADEWTDVMRKLLLKDRTTQGYIEAFDNELAVTNPSGSTIRVATGAALVDGSFYESDANVDNSIATPAASTRIDRIVLRKSWASQTVRVTIITGVEGGGVPSLTQTDGVTWDIALAQASITTGGAITMTDVRVLARTPLSPAGTPAMVEIETINGDGVITTFDFQNIPTTPYKNLLILGQGRIDTAVLEATLSVRFNNDSGANYILQNISGANAVAAAAVLTGQTEIDIGFITGASGIANHASYFQIYISNFLTTTFFKNLLSDNGHLPNATAADFDLVKTGGLWEDATAINRITLINSSVGALITGSIATLYGIE